MLSRFSHIAKKGTTGALGITPARFLAQKNQSQLPALLIGVNYQRFAAIGALVDSLGRLKKIGYNNLLCESFSAQTSEITSFQEYIVAHMGFTKVEKFIQHDANLAKIFANKNYFTQYEFFNNLLEHFNKFPIIEFDKHFSGVFSVPQTVEELRDVFVRLERHDKNYYLLHKEIINNDFGYQNLYEGLPISVRASESEVAAVFSKINLSFAQKIQEKERPIALVGANHLDIPGVFETGNGVNTILRKFNKPFISVYLFDSKHTPVDSIDQKLRGFEKPEGKIIPGVICSFDVKGDRGADNFLKSLEAAISSLEKSKSR